MDGTQIGFQGTGARPPRASGKGPRLDRMMGPIHWLPITTNVSQTLNAQSFNATFVMSSGDFQVPQGPNGILNAYNVTSRVATDFGFRYLDQATAYAAVTNAVFAELYFYEFNRSYQMYDWDPNAPVSVDLISIIPLF